ncbi:hypothetical protein CEXT_350421 [Caerostris extrusa]|uniref:Uncharacterized protein n=1 Tax=Caerostris extrusa TaxID=172846 RepID=A0AAV4Y0K9_CAEEX|nr:hypothetical protein CEXT_350421 [Caerostris extrusa]
MIVQQTPAKPNNQYHLPQKKTPLTLSTSPHSELKKYLSRRCPSNNRSFLSENLLVLEEWILQPTFHPPSTKKREGKKENHSPEGSFMASLPFVHRCEFPCRTRRAPFVRGPKKKKDDDALFVSHCLLRRKEVIFSHNFGDLLFDKRAASLCDHTHGRRRRTGE